MKVSEDLYRKIEAMSEQEQDIAIREVVIRRKVNNITQPEVSETMGGVAVPHVSSIENCKPNISIMKKCKYITAVNQLTGKKKR